ncbi:MAG: hypothetical protein NTU53_23045 [Planctomycetota bacterium]|nr:hypothetical protein [Planctomycetota bacterium]
METMWLSRKHPGRRAPHFGYRIRELEIENGVLFRRNEELAAELRASRARERYLIRKLAEGDGKGKER